MVISTGEGMELKSGFLCAVGYSEGDVITCMWGTLYKSHFGVEVLEPFSQMTCS